MSKPSDLVQGTLDLLILKILVLKPLNGWAIGQRLKQISDEVLQVSDGSLYPALHKLEHEGWDRFKHGQVEEAEFWSQEDRELYRALLAFRPDRLELVRRLKSSGYKVCVATNFFTEWL